MRKTVDRYFPKDKATGRYFTRTEYRDVLPAWLTWQMQDLQGPLPLPTIAPSQLLGFTQPYWSVEGLDRNLGTPFEGRYLLFSDSLLGQAQSDIMVTFKEMGDSRYYMNRPIHIRAICGSAQFPSVLREPLLLPSMHTLQAQFTRLAPMPLDSSVYVYLCGAQFYPWGPRIGTGLSVDLTALLTKQKTRREYIRPYWLTTETPVVLLPGQQVDVTCKLGDDFQFEAMTFMGISSTGEQFGIEITEVESGRNLMNGTVSKAAGIGDVFNPTIFPVPFMIPGGSRIRYTVKDLGSLVGQEIYLVLHGRAIYAPMRQVEAVTRDTAVEAVTQPYGEPVVS